MSARILFKVGIGLGLCNYALYALVSILAGGDVFQGHVVAGHYLILAGGGFVEISRMLFLFVHWAAYGLIATFPLGLLCACSLSPEMRPEESGLCPGAGESWSAAIPNEGR